jgi:hypothetical protein
MKLYVYAAVAAAYVAALAITFCFVQAGEQRSSLPFVMGAIVGTQAGVFALWKGGLPALTRRAKIRLALALAGTATVAGFITDVLLEMSRYPEVTLPIAALGSGIFPFVLADTFWKPLAQMRNKEKPPAV